MGGYPDSRLKICLFSYMYNVFLCRCITKGDGCCTALTGVDCRRAGPAQSHRNRGAHPCGSGHALACEAKADTFNGYCQRSVESRCH